MGSGRYLGVGNSLPVRVRVKPGCAIGAVENIRPIAGRRMSLNGIISQEYPEVSSEKGET